MCCTAKTAAMQALPTTPHVPHPPASRAASCGGPPRVAAWLRPCWLRPRAPWRTATGTPPGSAPPPPRPQPRRARGSGPRTRPWPRGRAAAAVLAWLPLLLVRGRLLLLRRGAQEAGRGLPRRCQAWPAARGGPRARAASPRRRWSPARARLRRGRRPARSAGGRGAHGLLLLRLWALHHQALPRLACGASASCLSRPLRLRAPAACWGHCQHAPGCGGGGGRDQRRGLRAGRGARAQTRARCVLDCFLHTPQHALPPSPTQHSLTFLMEGKFTGNGTESLEPARGLGCACAGVCVCVCVCAISWGLACSVRVTLHARVHDV